MKGCLNFLGDWGTVGLSSCIVQNILKGNIFQMGVSLNDKLGVPLNYKIRSQITTQHERKVISNERFFITFSYLSNI